MYEGVVFFNFNIKLIHAYVLIKLHQLYLHNKQRGGVIG